MYMSYLWLIYIATTFAHYAPDPLGNRETPKRDAYNPPDSLDHAFKEYDNYYSFRSEKGYAQNPPDSLDHAFEDYDNYYSFGSEYQVDDVLSIYDEFRAGDDLWFDDLVWDDISEFKLASNEKVIQKCSHFDDDDSFCVCKFSGYKKKYECKEEQNRRRYFGAKNGYEDEVEELASSSDEWNEKHSGTVARKYGTIHHVFNDGLGDIPTIIYDAMKTKFPAQVTGSDKDKYIATWNIHLSGSMAKKVFADQISKAQKYQKVSESVATGDAQNQAWPSILQKFKYKVDQVGTGSGKKKGAGNEFTTMNEGYGYLLYDDNSKDFEGAKSDLVGAISAMISGGTASLSKTKDLLKNAVKKMTDPKYAIRIKGLKRWYKGGTHAGQAVKYGPRGFQVATSVFVDAPVLRFRYENVYEKKGGWKPTTCINTANGNIINDEQYQWWLLMKHVYRTIKTKLKGLPVEIEGYVNNPSTFNAIVT